MVYQPATSRKTRRNLYTLSWRPQSRSVQLWLQSLCCRSFELGRARPAAMSTNIIAQASLPPNSSKMDFLMMTESRISSTYYDILPSMPFANPIKKNHATHSNIASNERMKEATIWIDHATGCQKQVADHHLLPPGDVGDVLAIDDHARKATKHDIHRVRRIALMQSHAVRQKYSNVQTSHPCSDHSRSGVLTSVVLAKHQHTMS